MDLKSFQPNLLCWWWQQSVENENEEGDYDEEEDISSFFICSIINIAYYIQELDSITQPIRSPSYTEERKQQKNTHWKEWLQAVPAANAV